MTLPAHRWIRAAVGIALVATAAGFVTTRSAARAPAPAPAAGFVATRSAAPAPAAKPTPAPAKPSPAPTPARVPKPTPTPTPTRTPAAKPPPAPTPAPAAKPSPAPTPAGPAPPPPAAAPAASPGYWLSVELSGVAAARGEAIAHLAKGLGSGPPSELAPPVGLTGDVVGRVDEIQAALDWVSSFAFAVEPEPLDPPTLRLSPAAVPGGALRERFGVQVLSFAIAGSTTTGDRRLVDWPTDAKTTLPPDLPWLVADLVPERAPIFAAPAASVPPASERHGMATRAGQIFVVRFLDRCREPEHACMRWAQVVARTADRFIPGYLPAYVVAVRRDWARGAGPLPRATLIRSGVEGTRARYVLLARLRDNTLHRTTLRAAMDGNVFPDADVSIDGDHANVVLGGAADERIPLDARLDRRPKDATEPTPPAEDAAGPPAADAPDAARSADR